MSIQMAGVSAGTGVGKLDGVARSRRRTMIESGNTFGGIRAVIIVGLIEAIIVTRFVYIVLSAV